METQSLTKPENQIDKSVMSVIIDNVGLSKFVRRVHTTSGIGISIGLLSSYLLSYSKMSIQYPYHFIFGGCFAAIMSLLGIHTFGRTQITDQYSNDKIGYRMNNSLLRTMSYGTLCMSMGSMLAPIVNMARNISPHIFPLAATVAVLVKLGAIAYAYYRPQDELMKWKSSLGGALTGFTGLAVLRCLFELLGMTSVAELLFRMDVYFGLLLFTLLTAQESQEAVTQYNKGNADHLQCATGLYMNYMNIFIRLLILIMERKEKKKGSNMEQLDGGTLNLI